VVARAFASPKRLRRALIREVVARDETALISVQPASISGSTKHMTFIRWIISALWLVFLVYWAIAAIGVKRNVKAAPWWKYPALRLGIAALLIASLSIPAVRRALRLVHADAGHSLLLGAIGALLVAAGIGLAIFARAYLGRNWGTPMSRKLDPELITGGPYAFIRHPIYSGIILAMVGAAVGLSIVFVVPLIVLIPYFIYSARREEEFMCEQFGETYRAYMRRTRMLVPFVL
jgi:protein-S-isoprenylcysteine O-methyltransferase Ste14